MDALKKKNSVQSILPGLFDDVGGTVKKDKPHRDLGIEHLRDTVSAYEKTNNLLMNKVKELSKRKERIWEGFVENIKTGKGNQQDLNESAAMVEEEIVALSKEIVKNTERIEKIRVDLPRDSSRLEKVGRGVGKRAVAKIVGMAIIDSNPVGFAANAIATEIGVRGFEGIAELSAASSKERAAAKEFLKELGVDCSYRIVNMARYHMKLGFAINEKNLFEKRVPELKVERAESFRTEEMLAGRYPNGEVQYLLNYTKVCDAMGSIHDTVEGAYFNRKGELLLLTTDVAWLHHEMGYFSVREYKFDEKNLQKKFWEVFRRLWGRAKFEGVEIKEQPWLEEKLAMRT